MNTAFSSSKCKRVNSDGHNRAKTVQDIESTCYNICITLTRLVLWKYDITQKFTEDSREYWDEMNRARGNFRRTLGHRSCDRHDVKHGRDAKRAAQQAAQRLHENYKSLTGNIDNKINAAEPGLFGGNIVPCSPISSELAGAHDRHPYCGNARCSQSTI